MKFRKHTYIVFVSLFLSSCMIGGKYQRPNLNLPEHYRDSNGVTSNQDTLAHRPSDFFKNASLLALLDSAFIRNSDLLIAVHNITFAEATMSSVKRNYLPELSTQINGNGTRASKNSLIGQTSSQLESKDFNFSAMLSWDMDIWGRIKNEKEEALANYLKMHEVRKAVQTKLVADIALGYYNLLMLDEQLNIALRSMELSDSTLQMMKVQYEVGDADMLGVRQIEAQLEDNKILVSQIQMSISAQENALNILCGNYAASISRKREIGDEFANSPSEGYPVALLAARPDIKAAELSLKAANARVGIQQAAMYPSINVSLTSGLNSLTSSNWFSVPASLFGTVAGGLTQPIFNRKRLKTQYQLAQIEREKEVVAFRQAVLEGCMQVSDALKNKEEIEKQYIFATTKEKVMEDNVSSIRVLFRAGAIRYLDIITVQSTYLEARLQTARIRMEKAMANVKLYYALGGGWQ
jgi:NodT family efflux transporter outer membrane factor (OMF) lipoprotein